MEDKLVFVKVKIEDNPQACEGCDIPRNKKACCGRWVDGLCELGFHYKIQKEEPKIQTEYEWKKERLELIKRVGKTEEHTLEFHNLNDWISKNKPTNYVTCNRENTKVGDEVRSIGGCVGKKVSYILNHSNNLAIMSPPEGGKDFSEPKYLANFEINILKDKE